MVEVRPQRPGALPDWIQGAGVANNAPGSVEGKTDGDRAEPATHGDGGVDLDTVPGPLKRPAGFLRRHRGNFYLMIVMLVVGFAANGLMGDLYGRYVSPWKDVDPGYVARLEAQQRGQFEQLNQSLAAIQGKLPREGREAFDALQQSLANVERDSAGLIHQLDLAHRQIESLSALAAERGGLGSGHDFTLSQGNSMDLAPGAVVGVTSVARHGNGVRVSLTSGGVQAAKDRFLKSGESLSYVGAQGRECWVSLMAVRAGEPGAASFKSGCKDG